MSQKQAIVSEVNAIAAAGTPVKLALSTYSRQVAKHFKKAHKNILRAFDQLDCSPEYQRLNFQPLIETYTVGNGATRESRVVRMTKDGFIFKVLGFQGAEAGRIKGISIAAFNAMADQLSYLGKSLSAQRPALERRAAGSFELPSWGASKMAKRRHEKPLFDNERALPEAETQFTLFSTQLQK